MNLTPWKLSDMHAISTWMGDQVVAFYNLIGKCNTILSANTMCLYIVLALRIVLHSPINLLMAFFLILGVIVLLNYLHKWKCNIFLAPLAIGQWAYVMVSCPSCVRPCINFFFKHLILWNYLSDFDEISQKCSCYGPLQNFMKEFDSVKNCSFHGNKPEKILKTLKIFSSETIRVRATKFGM